MFLRGAPVPYTGDPVVYNADGIPTCCGQTPQLSGDLGVSGDAVVAHHIVESPYSNIALAGGEETSHAAHETGAGDLGLSADADVVLNCSSYSFVCSGETITMHVVTLDALWQGVSSGGVTWSLINRRSTTILPPGSWRITSVPSSGQFAANAWNGRGAKTFSRVGLTSSCTGNPATRVVTGSCS